MSVPTRPPRKPRPARPQSQAEPSSVSVVDDADPWGSGDVEAATPSSSALPAAATADEDDDDDEGSDVFEDSSAVPLDDSPEPVPAPEPAPIEPPLHSFPDKESASGFGGEADDAFDDVPFDEPAASSSLPPAAAAPAAFAEEDDGFDDFDDPPALAAVDGFGPDDDFGDFGDFDDAGVVGASDAFDEMDLEEVPPSTAAVQPQPPPPAFPTLDLQPLPDSETLASLIQEILRPVFSDLDIDTQLGSEELREVPGLGQVLINQSGRDLYNSLTSPPALTTLNWTRSRVRREHLINLGVPVNLDEVASSRATSLPPLRIITAPARPTSTPPVDRGTGGGPKRSNTIGGSSLAPRRAGPNQAVRSGSSTPRSPGPAPDVDLGARGRKEKTYGLGARPEVDLGRATALLDHAADSLSLMSLASLEALQQSLEATTAEASARLSYLLQLRDAQQNEALVSNGMIAELVLNAQKAALAGKTSGGSGSSWRRSVGSRSPAPG